MTSALLRLTRQVREDLALLNYPSRPWVRQRQTLLGQPLFDVLIIGGGQGGLSVAFGLLRERITNLLVVDNHALDFAGPWRTFARMRTLRTPKYLTGPDLGIPSLTPRAFYEAKHGEGSWSDLGQIPKETWADYLRWYRETLDIPVQSETQVTDVAWDAAERAFRVCCTTAAGQTTQLARRVVFRLRLWGTRDG